MVAAGAEIRGMRVAVHCAAHVEGASTTTLRAVARRHGGRYCVDHHHYIGWEVVSSRAAGEACRKRSLQRWGKVLFFFGS